MFEPLQYLVVRVVPNKPLKTVVPNKPLKTLKDLLK